MSRTEDLIKKMAAEQEALEKSLREGAQPAAVSPTGAAAPGAPAMGRFEAMQPRRAPIVARSAESVDRDEEKRRARDARKQAERAQKEAEQAAREAAERAAAAPPKYVLPPDMAQVVDYGKVYDWAIVEDEPTRIGEAARDLGMTPERLKEVAQAQGVSLDDIYNARLKGRTYDEYARAAKERGVVGFLSVEEREKELNKFAPDLEASKAGVASDKPIALQESRAGAQVFMGTSTALPEVAREGEYAHTLASVLVDSLLKQDRPSELYDLYGRKTATGATQQYVEDRVKDLVRSTNLRADTPDFDERMQALRRRAFNEVLAYKTIGMWTPVITAMDVEAVEGRRDPTLWEAATTPNIEIIGVNNKRQAIYRMESPVGVVMRAFDLPQSAVVGVVSGQGAARGVQTGANFLEFALDATEGQSALVRVPAVAAGLAASIFSPDALSTGAAALKGVRAISQARRVAKLAPRAVELMEEVATARNLGRYDDAVKAEVKLRDEFPAVADDLDRKDARMAESIDIIDPKSDILNEDLASLLGSRIPLTSAREAANYRPYLHPSRRRQVLEGTAPSGTTTTFADYGDLFDTERHLKAVAKAKTDYMTNGPRTVEDYAAARIRGGVRSVFASLPADVASAVNINDVEKLANGMAAQAALALSDPGKFAEEAKKLIGTAIKGADDNSKAVRKAFYARRNAIASKVDSLRGADIKALQSADLALFDRMQNAVTANNEARAAAAALLRDQLAENAKIIVQPMNIFDQVAVKTPDGKPIQLTEGGHILLFSLRKAAPNMSFKDAYAAAAMIDAVIRAQAMKRGIDPYELYKNVFPDLRKGTSFDMERFLKAAAGKGPAPSSATPPAALPFEVSVSARSALEATPPIPAGYKAQDIKKVEDAKKVIKAAFSDDIPEVKLTVIEPGTQKTVESVSVVVGDARIIIDRTPNVEEFNVIVSLGEGADREVETVLKVKGRGRAQAVGQRAIEALMNARVKAKGPAIFGAPVKDTAAAKAAPPTAPAAAPTPTPTAPAPAAVTPPPAVVQPAPAVTPAPPAPAAKPGVLPALADTVKDRKEQLRQYLRKNPGINLGILFNKFDLTPEDMRQVYDEVKAERVPAAVPAPAPAEAPTPAPAPQVVATSAPEKAYGVMQRAFADIIVDSAGVYKTKQNRQDALRQLFGADAVTVVAPKPGYELISIKFGDRYFAFPAYKGTDPQSYADYFQRANRPAVPGAKIVRIDVPAELGADGRVIRKGLVTLDEPRAALPFQAPLTPAPADALRGQVSSAQTVDDLDARYAGYSVVRLPDNSFAFGKVVNDELVDAHVVVDPRTLQRDAEPLTVWGAYQQLVETQKARDFRLAPESRVWLPAGVRPEPFDVAEVKERVVYAQALEQAERAGAPTPAPIPAAVPPTPAPITAAVEAQPEAAKIVEAPAPVKRKRPTRVKAAAEAAPEAAPAPEVKALDDASRDAEKQLAEVQKKSAADAAARAEAVEMARQEKNAKKLAELEAQRKIRDAEKQRRLEAYQAEQVRLAEEKAKKLAEREAKAKAKAEEAAKRLAERQAKAAAEEARRAAEEARRQEEARLFVEAAERAEAAKAREMAEAAARKAAEEKRAAEAAARLAEIEADQAARAAKQAEREAEAARVATEQQRKASAAREAIRAEYPQLAELEDRFPVARPANLKAVLREVRAATTNESYKRIIDRLLEQGGRFNNAQFRVVQMGDVVPSGVAQSISNGASGTTTTTFAGELAPHGVYVRGTSLGKIDFPLDELILHEAIHAATVDQYEIGIRVGAKGTPTALAAEAINELQGQVVRELSRRLETGGDLAGFSRSDLARMVDKSTELIAYGLSNPQFQSLLKTIKVESTKSAWTKFVEGVARLLGLAPSDETALSVLLERTERLMDLPSDELEATRRMVFPNATPEEAVAEMRVSLTEAPAAAPVAEGAPDVFPSIERDARRASIVRREKARQAEIMLGEIYGRSIASEWEPVPEQYRVNAGRRLNKALEGLREKRITEEQFNELVRNVGLELDARRQIRRARTEMFDPARGPDIVRSRLLAAKAEGAISEEGADLAEWFVRQNPQVADDLAIMIGEGRYINRQLDIDIGKDTAGLYSPLYDIVALVRGSGNDLTATHEVLHRTERMLPEALQVALRTERTKQLTKAIKTASDKDRPFLLALLTPSRENLELRRTAFQRGNLDPAKYYQFANTSEFWAVNASRIVSGRYAAFNRGLVARAKQWLTEFAQKVKSVFRLSSDAPIIRGLDAVIRGDGTFVSQEMLSQGDLFRSIETQAPVPSGITEDALRQVSPTGEIKGAVETLADGKTILYLFEGADASTIIHEAGHILRRSILDNDDMGAITDWIKSQGVNVGHEFGEFVGGAADIEKAEEMFAQAFERYAREGIVPPSAPLLASVFASLKTALENIYRAVNDPVIGAELQPDVRAVFDKMFEGATTTANPTILEKVRRTLLGKAGPGFEGVLTTISREAKRKGITGFTEEDVFRLVDEAKKNGMPSNQPVLRFPVKVNGKKDWSADDLAEAQTNAEIAHLDREARRIGIRLDLTARGKGKTPAMIIEDKATEALRSLFAAVEGERGVKKNVRAVGRVIVGSFLGGDMVADKGGALLRNAPPALRAVLDGVERVVQMAIGDTITLVNAAIDTGKDTELVKYLVGQSRVTRQSGRPILSAGHNHMNAVLGMFNGLFSKLSDEELVLLQGLADALNSNDPGTAITRVGFNADGSDFRAANAAAEAARNSIITAYTKTLNVTQQANKSELGATLAGAVRNAVQAVRSPRPSHELKLMETLLYLTKKTSRNGAYFAGSDEDAVRMILKEVKDIFDDESSRRVAVLIGSFGGADQAKRMLVNMNLGISADAERNFKQWVVNGSVDEKYKPEIQRIVDRYGFNPNFVADPVLGVNFYLPEMARERLANALARGNYREAATVMTSAADAFNMLYRYMKLRMTRGSFVTKGRYFMMNTADHGTALGTVIGFGVGAASTARLLPQNLLVIPPLVGQVIDLPGRIPGSPIPRNFTERVRRGLQAAGDRGAWAVGQIFSTGKYRIEVNPILEGVDGTFRAGGNVYTYRDVRNIAVEEGIFSSFDTSQLQSLILKEGQLQLANTQIFRTPSLRAAPGSLTSATAKLNNFFAELSDSVADLAEAWGERERLGAMVTLMEAGYSPRVAARLTIDALFDYAQTMTKNDRGFLVSVLFPFWAFQKNANAQVFNLIFSPAGAYRAMVIKRMKDRTADLASELLYDEVGSEYGIDVKSMPPELQDTYYGIMTAFYDAYDGNPPEDAKRAMRLILTGRAVGVESGKYFETAYKLMEQRGAGAFADVNKFGQYVSLRPEKSARMSTFRDRTGIAVPFPRTEAVRRVYGYLGDNHTYMEIFWPESTFEAGMKYHTQVLAGMVLLGAKGIEMVVPGTGMEEGGIEGVSLANVLEPVVSVERSPILGPILPSILTGQPEGATPPRRIARPLADTAAAVVEIHPAIAKTLSDAYAVNFFRTPKDADPFIVGADGKLPQLSDEEVERIRKLNDKAPGLGVAKDERIYMVGGVFSTVLYNTPVGELNDLLLRWESEPLARADIRGEILEWAKIYGGVDVSVVSASKTMRAEEPTKLKESKKY